MSKIDRLLSTVLKPTRYAGGELNQTVKQQAALRFGFCFPDVYEVGMSHLGTRILYHILNSREEIACERAFMPWIDMQAVMKAEDIPLFTLETRTPLSQCDILGFTLQYELSATNMLAMLELAGLPLRTADRLEGGPLVIAGGPCAANPEPLAPFIDAFVIGDGEEAILDVCDAYSAWKASGDDKRGLLMRLSQVAGVYVPSCHQQGAKVKKRIVKSLDDAPFPDSLIVPFGEIVHDRVTLEVARGCTKGCRFCQAGMWYRPVRERSAATLLRQAEGLIGCTGYEEISLSSLSTGDYSQLPELALSLVERFAKDRVSVSLPSLRIDSVIGNALKQTGQVRKTSLTFAPEAGTQRLRDVINKGVTEDDLLRAVGDAFKNGWSSVKLYFMIGLPTETFEDLDGIADLARKVLRAYAQTPRQPGQKPVSITVSAASFVPKPHTPFQWAKQDDIETLSEKQRYLKKILRMRGVTFNWHDPGTSFIEAALARGDSRLANVIETAYRSGCQLDGWSEHFKLKNWLEAFQTHGLNAADFAGWSPELNDALPWDFIDSGVTKAYLQREWHRATKGEVTPDCRDGCEECGLDCFARGV